MLTLGIERYSDFKTLQHELGFVALVARFRQRASQSQTQKTTLKATVFLEAEYLTFSWHSSTQEAVPVTTSEHLLGKQVVGRESYK